MKEVFSNKAKKILFIAQEESAFLGKTYVGPEHILLAIVREADESLKKVLTKFNLRYNFLRVEIETLTADSKIRVAQQRDMTPIAKLVLRNAVEETQGSAGKRVEIEHLLIAVLKLEEGIIPVLFREINVDCFEVISELSSSLSTRENKRARTTKESLLDRCAIDLTNEAANDRLDPVIGRDTEIKRMIRILSRRSKNNPVLIGDPGVGKTAIVEGLAQRIVTGDIPEVLEDKKLYQLSLSSLIAGAKFRGDFEERVKNLLDEIKNRTNVVIFIDEVHTIVGAGAPEGNMDAANILKPALARGDIQLIGATTIDEYRKHIEKDMALERRFQPIMVDEPTIEETASILSGLRNKFEEFHKISISDDAVEKAARLAARYINDRFLPDKAIDLLDESSAQLKLDSYCSPSELKRMKKDLALLRRQEDSSTKEQDFEDAAIKHCQSLELEQKISLLQDSWERQKQASKPVLTGEHIAHTISEWTGIPLQKLKDREISRMLDLEKLLGDTIIGQEQAIKSIGSTIRRARVNLANPDRPLGSFIFLGPSGVGKTATARALAQTLFDSEDNLVSIDMSELMEKHAVSRLIGAPPGYIGFEKGGQLTERVRRKPYSVILFDEIEKAHPDVFNILLQILEDGRLTSAQGKKVNFKNTIIIMTSNLGTRDISEGSSVGFVDSASSDPKNLEKTLVKELKSQMNPELVNRIDEIIVFNQLTLDDLKQIARNELVLVCDRLADNGINIDITDELIAFLAHKAHTEKYGARPLKRLIERLVCDKLAENILQGQLSDGDMIKVSLDKVTEEILISKNY